MTDTKTCSKCGQEKSLEEFHRNANNRDGRVPHCKTCVAAYQSEYRRKNPAKAAATR